MSLEIKTQCWAPWLALDAAPVIPTRRDLCPSLFLGSRYSSVGDHDREIFQGGAGKNQCVAVAINGDVAKRLVHAGNCHDDMVAALVAAISHIDHMAAFFGNKGLGYSFEGLSEDMPGIRAALSKAEPMT